MKFSCEKALLQSAIAVTSRAVAQKSSIPALEGLLLHADSRLTISGYNLQTGIRTKVSADVTEPGEIVLNARLFGDIIRRMPDDMITFTADEKMMVHVSCGDADFDILGLSAADYPDLPEVEDEYAVSMQQKVLRSMIEEVAFAVSTGYMRRMPLAYRLKTMFFFYLFAPVSIWLTGYLKAKKFGLMEDLPRNIVRDWRDWCEEEAYFFHPKFKEKKLKNIEIQSFNFPVAIFTASDDTISTPRNIASFWKRIKNNKKTEFIELSPEKYGVFQIGHMGVFRRKFKDTIWQEALAKLNAMWLQTGD